MTEIATFRVDYTQYLNEQGKAIQELPAWAHDVNALIDMYRTMVIVRAHDTKAVALQRTGQMGTYASILGQEAISTAVGRAMQTDDVLVPFYRDYAAQVQRGVKMADIYRYWGGDERGSCYADNQDDLPICVPIASQCLHATGVATAFKLRKQARVAVASCGDGGTSEGDFYEALNVAGAWNLPVVFVVNNNQWAISVPRAKQTKAQTIAQKAIAAGFTGVQVDGNDVIAMYDAMSVALDKARRGDGPTLIEGLSYRLCDHTTADDASRYRNQEEVDAAWQKEPIRRMRQYLVHCGEWDEGKEEQLQADAKVQVEKTVEDYLATSTPALESIFDYHYANLPAALEEQKREAIEDKHHA